MKKFTLFSFLFVLLITAISCNNIKTPNAIKEREQWFASFNDSINKYKTLSNDIDIRLANCTSSILSQLESFEYISNPKEVTGYYILKGWHSKLPFTSTGIYARINEYEKIELIATLKGGVFNRIAVSNGSTEIKSSVIPHDQAFNYRHAGYNTVCFSDSSANEIAKFISQNKTEKLQLIFINANQKNNFVIPANEKTMISKTWELFSNQQEQKKMQKELWINAKKMDVFQRMLETSDSQMAE